MRINDRMKKNDISHYVSFLFLISDMWSDQVQFVTKSVVDIYVFIHQSVSCMMLMFSEHMIINWKCELMIE